MLKWIVYLTCLASKLSAKTVQDSWRQKSTQSPLSSFSEWLNIVLFIKIVYVINEVIKNKIYISYLLIISLLFMRMSSFFSCSLNHATKDRTDDIIVTSRCWTTTSVFPVLWTMFCRAFLPLLSSAHAIMTRTFFLHQLKCDLKPSSYNYDERSNNFSSIETKWTWFCPTCFQLWRFYLTHLHWKKIKLLI